MLEIKTTTQFERDLKLLKKRGYNLKLLKNVIDTLADGKKLEAKQNIKIIFYREIVPFLKNII